MLISFSSPYFFFFFFFFNDTATTEIYTLSLHDALPIYRERLSFTLDVGEAIAGAEFVYVCVDTPRSEEHTSELQSLAYLVCRLLLEKKKKDTLATYLSHHTTMITPTGCDPLTRTTH